MGCGSKTKCGTRWWRFGAVSLQILRISPSLDDATATIILYPNSGTSLAYFRAVKDLELLIMNRPTSIEHARFFIYLKKKEKKSRCEI
jgi:hypothetical protein